MTPFAENNLGVAAVDYGEVAGFLCGYGVDNAFGIPGLRHVFSPMHANGTVRENRAKIYARLYHAAGEKWAGAGASSHGVCLYAHDCEGQAQFFRYGFGIRCVDAIRGMDGDIDAPPCDGYTFAELAPENVIEAFPLDNRLVRGFMDSPFFMLREPDGEAEFLQKAARRQSIYFAARWQGQTVAFIRAEPGGETCIQDTPGYLHCTGLYCLPEHRGRGVSQRLLDLLIRKVRAQGRPRLGVDFESINPSGYGFWLKYFDAYTRGVVRRIDQHVVVPASGERMEYTTNA